jgi:hypothetical protein
MGGGDGETGRYRTGCDDRRPLLTCVLFRAFLGRLEFEGIYSAVWSTTCTLLRNENCETMERGSDKDWACVARCSKLTFSL